MGTTIAAYALAAVAAVVLVIMGVKKLGKLNKQLGGVDAVRKQMEAEIEADDKVHEAAGRPIPVGLPAQLRRMRALAKAAPAAWRGEVSSDE
jgi:Sec-independent protein translocase protein TatA